MANANKPKYKKGQKVTITNDIAGMLGVNGTILEARESKDTEPVYRIDLGQWYVFEGHIAPVGSKEAREAIRERFGDFDDIEDDTDEEEEVPVADYGVPPLHYAGLVEPLDLMRAQFNPYEYTGFLKGNIIKYASRMGKKRDTTALEDAEKVLDYARLLVDWLSE